MSRQPRKKSNNRVYHVIVRGANRQEIFHDDDDRIKFLDILYKVKIISGMKVFAWCLMGNHVHLLIKEEIESISVAMKRIGVSYANYYNCKYQTTGHLFQDRFKSENVETAKYLLTVTRYIHQNPVKAGIVSTPPLWKWSSCQGYYGKFVYPPDLLDPHYLLNLFSPNTCTAQARFKEFNEWINQDKCLEDQSDTRRLSDDEARVEIRKCIGELEIPQLKTLPKGERDKVLKRVKRIEGVSQKQAARILGVAVYFLYKVKG